MAAVQGVCSNCGTEPTLRTQTATKRVRLRECAKCRQAAYCDVNCQRAHWETHRTNCKPCSTYAFEQATLAHKAGDWRKTLKWSGFIEELMRRDIQPRPDIDEMRRDVLRVFIWGYGLAVDATGEDRYARDAIALLHEQIDLHVKYQRFHGQVGSIYMLGRFLTLIGNDITDKQVIECYQQAYDIETTHGMAIGHNTGLALGRIARAQGRHVDAKNLLGTALATVQQTDDKLQLRKMAVREMEYSQELIELLLDTGEYEEVGPLARQYNSLLIMALGPAPEGLFPEELYAHLYLARVHDARGERDKMAREVRELIALVEKNKDAVLQWRHTFVLILRDIHKLVMPRDGKKWDDDLLVPVRKMSNAYGVPVNGMGGDGTEWKPVFI
jgi:hypothetical protein